MKFYGGRFSILPINNNMFYVPGIENKFSIITNILKENKEFKARKDIRIIIEPKVDEHGNLIGGKIGRETVTKLPMRKDGSLSKVKTPIIPHVSFLIDETEQLILIERDSDVFSNPLAVFNYLTKFLNEQLFDLGVEVDIKPLTHKGEFWGVLNNLDFIYSIKFKLKAPNFLGHSYDDLKTILEQEKEDANANEIEFGVSNEAGKLKKPSSEKYDAAVGWSEDGGGEWEIKGKEKGRGNKRKTFKNTLNISMFDVEIAVETIDVKELKMIKRKINIGAHRIKGDKNDS